MRTDKTYGNVASQRVAVAVSGSTLQVTVDGKVSTYSPVDCYAGYLSASVSPNGKFILFQAAGKGVFVCDLKGNIVAELGKLHAARWLDNNTIVAMNDTDNGVVITSSAIVAASLDGKRQTLTDASMKAMYPYASADGKKVVFTTDEGETYLINIK